MRNPLRWRRPDGPQVDVDNVRAADGTWYPPRTTGAGATRTALARLDVEERAITSVPWDTDHPMGGGTVDQTAALSLAAVYSATDLLASSVASLPIHGYRRIGDARIMMSAPPPLFATMINEGKIVPWLRRCMTSLLLRGNAIGLVLGRDRFGYPTQIDWLDPSQVYVLDRATSGRGSYTQPVWYWLGAEIATENIVHVPWYVTPQRVLGLSPLAAFAQTIGVGLAAQTYGREWFDGGGFPPGRFKNTEQVVSQSDATAIGNRLVTAMRTRRPLVYGRDWEYEPIAVPPDEAQFVETMRLSASQIAAIYHVPAEWIGGQSGQGLHYSTAEQDMTQMVTLGVRPYVELLESVFFALMPERQYVRFGLDALVRADLKTRHEVYALDASIGLRTIDEMRAQEDWGPHPDLAGADDDSDVARNLVEMIQKVYLGVGVVLTADEARALLNRAGAGLSPTMPVTEPEPEPTGEEEPESESTQELNGRARWTVPT